MTNKNDQIFIMTKRTGYIPQLRTYGPIVNPMKCPLSLCLSMLTAGVELHEFDPKTRAVVKLTVNNLYDKDKFKAEDKNDENELKAAVKTNVVETTEGVKVAPKMEPVKEEEPETVLEPESAPEPVQEDEKETTEPEVEKEEEESKPKPTGKKKK